MRFAFVLMTAFAVSVGTASAQDTIVFGAKAGVNFSNITIEDDDTFLFGETSLRTALLVGVFGSVPVNDRIAFQPEFLFTQKGAKLEEDGFDSTLKLDYFEIPLLADVRLNEGPTRISFIVGPALGFRSQAKVETDEEVEGVDELDLKEDVEGVDFGLVTGVAVTSGNFVVDGRYTWGLRNINKTEDEPSVKNRALSISVGWRFGRR